MSWYDECPLSREDIEGILLYLQLLRIRDDVYPNILLYELIDKLQRWLKE